MPVTVNDAADRAEHKPDPATEERDASDTTKAPKTSARKPHPPAAPRAASSSDITRTEQRRRAELKRLLAPEDLPPTAEPAELARRPHADESSPHSAAASRIEDALEMSIGDVCMALQLGIKTKARLPAPLLDRLQLRLAREEEACRAAEDWGMIEQSVLDGHLLSETELSRLQEWDAQTDGRPPCASPAEMDTLRRCIGLATGTAFSSRSLAAAVIPLTRPHMSDAPLTPAQQQELADLGRQVSEGKLLTPEELATLKQLGAAEANMPPHPPHSPPTRLTTSSSRPTTANPEAVSSAARPPVSSRHSSASRVHLAKTTPEAELSPSRLPVSSRQPSASKVHVAKAPAQERQESLPPPKPTLSSYKSSGGGMHKTLAKAAIQRAASAGVRSPNKKSASTTLPSDPLANRPPTARHAAPRPAVMRAKTAEPARRPARAAESGTTMEASAEPETDGEGASTRAKTAESARRPAKAAEGATTMESALVGTTMEGSAEPETDGEGESSARGEAGATAKEESSALAEALATAKEEGLSAQAELVVGESKTGTPRAATPAASARRAGARGAEVPGAEGARGASPNSETGSSEGSIVRRRRAETARAESGKGAETASVETATVGKPRAEPPSADAGTAAVGRPRAAIARASTASLRRAASPITPPTGGAAARPATACSGARATVQGAHGSSEVKSRRPASRQHSSRQPYASLSGEAERIADLERRVSDGKELPPEDKAELARLKEARTSSSSVPRPWSRSHTMSGETARIADLEKRVSDGEELPQEAEAELARLKEPRNASFSFSRPWSRVSSSSGLKLSPRWASLEYETVPFPRRAGPPDDVPGPGYYSPRTGFDTPHCKSQLAISHVSMRGRHWQATLAKNDTPGPASYNPIMAKDIRAGQSQLPRIGAYGTLPGQPMPKRRGPVVLSPRSSRRVVVTGGSKG